MTGQLTTEQADRGEGGGCCWHIQAILRWPLSQEAQPGGSFPDSRGS